MKLKECTVCGRKFQSHYGIEVCSEACRLERKRKQDEKGNYRRKKGLSNVPEIKKCLVCGCEFESHHNMVYCNKNCYNIAKKEKDKENYKNYYNDVIRKQKEVKK